MIFLCVCCIYIILSDTKFLTQLLRIYCCLFVSGDSWAMDPRLYYVSSTHTHTRLKKKLLSKCKTLNKFCYYIISVWCNNLSLCICNSSNYVYFFTVSKCSFFIYKKCATFHLLNESFFVFFSFIFFFFLLVI